MAFNGSGTFQRIYNWVTDAGNNVDIEASRMDTEMDGFATGLTNCVTKDGQTTITANLPMATYKHTGVGNASARTDYAATGQVQDDAFNYCTVGGTADAITLTCSPAITAYAAGQRFTFVAGSTNTSETVTVAISGLAATNVRIDGSNGPTVGQIKANEVYTIIHDGTQFQIDSTKVPGKETIWVSAGSMLPATTNGPATSQTETSSNDINLRTLDFDASTDEYAHFNVGFPKSWNEGSITFRPVWTTTATDTAGVAWGLQALALSDNESSDASWGAAVVVTDDAQSGATQLLVGDESAAITIAGTPAEGDVCFFRAFRDVSDANDDMTEDAKLVGLWLYFTSNAGNDA